MYKFPLGEQFVICSNHATPPGLRSLRGGLRTLVISAQGVDDGTRRPVGTPGRLLLRAAPCAVPGNGALPDLARIRDAAGSVSAEYLPGEHLPDYRLLKLNAHGPQGDLELSSFLGSSREADILAVRNRKTWLRKVPAYLGEAFEELKAQQLAYPLLYALVDVGQPSEHRAGGQRGSRHPSAYGPGRGEW